MDLTPGQLERQQPGHRVTAAEFNAIVAAVKRQIFAPGMVLTAAGWAQKPNLQADPRHFPALNKSGAAVDVGYVLVVTSTDANSGLPEMTKPTADNEVPAYIVRYGNDNNGQIYCWEPGLRPVVVANPGAAVIGDPVGATAASYSATVGNTGLGLCAGDTALPTGPANTFHVSLGVSSGGAVGPGTALFVLVWRDGGTTDGDGTTQCDRTYTVKTLDSATTLGTAMTPDKLRPAAGKLVTPATSGPGVVGVGYYDSGGSFALWDANEVFDVTLCA